jgi:hypothetical protein
MQEEKVKIVNDLKDKVKTLISIIERTKEENFQLFQEKQNLLNVVKEKDEEIKKYNKEIDDLKFANAISNGGSNEEVALIRHEAKIKINRMVREIDKCISLLNKIN